jgi:hypothetical protein
MASFYWKSIKSFTLPPLEAAGAIDEANSFLSLCVLSQTPLSEVCVICEKSKFGLIESSLWAFEHLSFMKQSLWHLLLLEVKPPRRLGIALELSRLWWVVGKFVKVCFSSARKEATSLWSEESGWKRPGLELALVINSNFLNESRLVIPNFGKQITVSIPWFATLWSCLLICLSN